MDNLKPQDTDAVHFWNCFVSQRKPVLLDGHLMDADWKATAKWDDAYLDKHAGDARVMVEQRDGPGGSYGQGRKVPMAFKDLLQRMREGDDTLYLTTQQVSVSKRDGHPELWGEPLCRLTQDFTPCPSLMGGLVPQQVNLWMGCAKDGASSGLHHDFHDNLYVLMRGQKRFRLWAPSHAPSMRTAGKISKVHPNGRIVYEGQGNIRADGSSASEVALWEACRSAEAAVQAAEQGVAEKRKGAAQALEAAEARLEAALDAQLTHKLSMPKSSGSKKKAEGSEEEEEEGEESSEEDDGSMDLLEGLQDDYMDEDAAESSQEEEKEGGHTGPDVRTGVEEEEGDPPSFCTGIDLSLPDEQLKAAFPGFPGKAAAMEVTLKAGQMLYLPAGWFHEVTSFSPQLRKKGKGSKSAAATGAPDAACGHMAVNLWFHPPDNLKARGSVGVARPYKSDYWPALWRSRAAALGLPVPSVHEAGNVGEHPEGPAGMESSDNQDETSEEDEENEGELLAKTEAEAQQQQQQQQQPTSRRQRKGQPKRLQPPPSKQQQEEAQPQESQQQQEGPSKRQRKGQPKKLQPLAKTSEQQQQRQEQQAGGETGEATGGSLLPGEDGELGDMVAEEMHSYFQSPEGSGAFKSALGTYMLKAMLKEQLKAMQKRNLQQRRCLRTKGRRHHRCVRSQDLEEADE